MDKAITKILILALIFVGFASQSGSAQSIYRRGNFNYSLLSDSALTHDYWYFNSKPEQTCEFSVLGNIGVRAAHSDSGNTTNYFAHLAPGFGFKKGNWQIEVYSWLTTTPSSFYNGNNSIAEAGNFPIEAKLGKTSLQIMPGLVVSYKAGKYVDISAGYDKNFIGEGYHSLFLSDNGSNYPFLRARVNLGKLEYALLYAYFDNTNSYKTNTQFPSNKYGAFHVLSYKPAHWLEIQLYESVVWQTRDSLNNRGFDVNYLNPVVFYRPIEYNTGSADNSLIGGAINIKPTKNITLYSQVLLDEFLMKEVRAGKGWWANKYGLLGGMKWFNVGGINGLSLVGEASLVRPFTYSHKTNNTNLGHNYKPLAHSWGANFYQLFFCGQYKSDRHRITATAELGRKGYGFGYGGSIFNSYDYRLQEYGNTVAQGLAYGLGNASMLYAYQLNTRHGLEIYIQAGQEILPNRTVTDIKIGLRTAFFNSYANY